MTQIFPQFLLILYVKFFQKLSLFKFQDMSYSVKSLLHALLMAEHKSE